jgi:sulfur-oxidizing protein SoxY
MRGLMLNRTVKQAIDRRAFTLGVASVAASIGIGGPAIARDMAAEVQSVLKSLIGDATPIDGKISLQLPEIAENGNTVPYSVTVESPMTETEFVKAVHILAPANPHPRVATFYLTSQSGKAAMSSRMRLGQTQDVLAIAEMSDGRVYMSERAVRVTVGGCGG